MHKASVTRPYKETGDFNVRFRRCNCSDVEILELSERTEMEMYSSAQSFALVLLFYTSLPSINRRRVFIVMLHLYGTRGNTKIWGENNFCACEEVQHAKVSVAEGRREGQKRRPLKRPFGA